MERFNHQQSVEKLKKVVMDEINRQFPYEKKDYRFEVKDVVLEEPAVDYDVQEKAFMTDDSIEAPVRATIETYYKDNLVKTHKNAVLVRVPFPTERGTYVVNGNELVILNRMQMRNGVYIHPMRNVDKRPTISGEVRVGFQRFMVNFDAEQGRFYLEGLSLDWSKRSTGKVNLINFLRFMGVDDGQIKAAINDDVIYNSLMEKTPALNRRAIFSTFFAEPYPGDDQAREMVMAKMNERLVFSDDSQKLNKQTIGTPAKVFDASAILSTMGQIMKEYKQPGSSEDPDDMRFKIVKSPEDTIAEFVQRGIIEWQRKRFNRISASDHTAKKEINAKPDMYISKSMNELYRSDLAAHVDSSNPLDVHQMLYSVTSTGVGALSTKSAKNENRNIQDTAFAKIDPVETPQSQKMGLSQHLAMGATIKNGRLYSKFYRVNNGTIDTSKVVDDIDPLDEYEEYIAFNTPNLLERDKKGKVTGFKNAMVRVRHKGDFKEVPKSKVTLIDQSPSSHLSHATSLIPFGAHNDGARMLMGAGMQKQSLSLENAEAPLVQSVADTATGKTVEQEMAERASHNLYSPVAGTVKNITDDFIEIDTGNGTERVKKLNYFTTGKAGGFINHTPVVKPGDTIKKGSLLADGWQSKNGTMALGRNTNVAYMPYEGLNFEDGVVVSESFARKMASEEVKTVSYEIDPEDGKTVFGKDAIARLKELHVSPGILSKLDENGLIKKGETVSSGDLFYAAVKEKEQQQMTAGQKDMRKMVGKGRIFTLPSDLYKNVSPKAVGYQKGKVIRATTSPGENGGVKVTIQLLSYKPMEEGDKLSGRHGNKGTISKIVPDKEMPHTQDGEAVELIFSPLAVPSRKNVGQLMEVNAGLIAKKKGLTSWNVENFNSDESKRLERELEEIGMPDGKQTLINPKTGKPFENPVTVGPMYIMKLKHKVESKITRRSMGKYDPILHKPRKTSGSIDGDRFNPQSVGGMEFWSLTSAGAVHNIHELTTFKSDGAGDLENRKKIFDAIRTGTPIPDPVTPQTLKALNDKLFGIGVKMTPLRDSKEVSLDEKFTELMLNPMKQKDLESIAKVPVTAAEGLKARTNTIVSGSIYDPEIFGEEGENWSRIDLVVPQPNPLFLDNSQGPRPYAAMLGSKGINQKDIKEIVQGDYFVVLDPKSSGFEKYQKLTADQVEEMQLDGKDAEVETGGAALAALLKDVDLKEELKLAEQELKAARNLKQRSDAALKARLLGTAIDNNMDPDDFMLKSLPVMPLKYRKPLSLGSGSAFAEDGLSKLYSRVLKMNQTYERTQESIGDMKQADPITYANFNKEYYQNLGYVIGSNKPFVDEKTGQEWKGVLHTLKSKNGFLREKMQSKMQDYSGRSVISVDPTLKLDEVSLPEDMVAEMFKPHILGELQRQRFNSKEIDKFTKNRTREYREAMLKVTEDHPVILNRQPSLHALSLQGFYPKIRWNEDSDSPNAVGKVKRNIGLNPIVTTGFNADFDGDTMAVHVPITQAAIQEVKDKLLPSKNLLNATNNGIITDLKHEMQLGIYYMTRDRFPQGVPKQYKNLQELEKAYNKGEVTTYQAVRMNVPGKGMVLSTAGKHLFNLSLPRGFQNYDDNVDVNKKQMQRILQNILDSPMGGQGKVVQTLNKLQTVGFQSATNSGVSIGIKDFDDVRAIDRDQLFQTAEKELKAENAGKIVSGYIDIGEAFDQEKSSLVRKKMEEMIKSNVLDPNNPVQIMQASGARGNAGQIAAMAGILAVGKDVTNKATRPINKSHIDGLSPDEFWDLTYDSRKGMFDKSIATQQPGALTRELWMHNKQTVITEKDCGDRTGILLNLKLDRDRRSLYGRLLLKDVPLNKGGVVRVTNMPLTPTEIDNIKKGATGPVNVRSPLSCKSTNGVCQKCYGRHPGSTTNQLAEIGTPVGSIAAQALGEPSQQAIMKAFHVGAGQSGASGSFDRIQELLRLPNDISDPTKEVLIAENNGIVTKIDSDPVTGKTVVIDKKKYKVGHKPLADNIVVGAGVSQGDLLTKEYDTDGKRIGYRNPHKVLAFQGPDVAKQYLLDNINEAYESGDISDTDTRHYELVTGNLMNNARITDPGNSPYAVGQLVPLKTLQTYNHFAGKTKEVSMSYANRMNVIGSIAAQDYNGQNLTVVVKKGEPITEDVWEKLKYRKFIKVQDKPLSFSQELQGVDTTNNPNQNWLDAGSFRNVGKAIKENTLLHTTDKLNTPLTQQMTGIKGNFAENYQAPKTPTVSDFIKGFI